VLEKPSSILSAEVLFVKRPPEALETDAVDSVDGELRGVNPNCELDFGLELFESLDFTIPSKICFNQSHTEIDISFNLNLIEFEILKIFFQKNLIIVEMKKQLN
jgi:hypothetical protein